MKRLLIAAAVLLLAQAACSLPVALGAPGLSTPTETAGSPGLFLPTGPILQVTQPAEATTGPIPTSAPPAAATVDPRITFLLAQLRIYLATKPHIHKVDRLELIGTTLDLEITTVYPNQADQASVAYETVKAIAGGLSLAPKDQVNALMKSGQGTLHLRVSSSDAAWNFVSDTPLEVLAGLQAGQVSQEAWMAASHYKPAQ